MSVDEPPAAKPVCEHYWAWVSPAGTSYSARLCMLCNEPDADWLNVVKAKEAACNAALRLAEQWDEGWYDSCRYAEWSKEYEILTDCADALLRALSPFVLPMIEAVGVVPWPDHDEQAVHERIDQKSTMEGSPLPLGGPKHTPTAENCAVGGPGAPISSGLVCRACPPTEVGA